MSPDEFSRETHYKIWNGKSGTHIEIGPDRDIPTLIAIRAIDADGREQSNIVLQFKEAELFAAALLKALDDVPKDR